MTATLTDMPNPFDSGPQIHSSAPARPHSLPSGESDPPVTAGSAGADPLPGLQISLAGDQLDVITFMAELGVVDLEFLR